MCIRDSSSREHAVWALADYGFRVVIAPSFADIFFNNCFKNGVLPICLEETQVEQLFRNTSDEPGYQIRVDLAAGTITDEKGLQWSFEVDSFRRQCLLDGLDDIGLTLAHADKICLLYTSDAADE